MNNEPMKRSNKGRNSSYEGPLRCPTKIRIEIKSSIIDEYRLPSLSMISEGDEIRRGYDGCKLGEGSG